MEYPKHVIYGNICRMLRDRGYNPPVNAISEPFLAMKKGGFEAEKLAKIDQIQRGNAEAETELKQLITLHHEKMKKSVEEFEQLYPRGRVIIYDEDGKIAVVIIGNSKLTKDIIDNYQREVVKNKPGIENLIFVFRGNKRKRMKYRGMTIEFLAMWELSFDPNLHVLVPFHQLIADRKNVAIDVKNLPRIKPDDRMVRWFGGRPGMIMKIIRHNVPNNVQEIAYRYIG